MRAAGGSTAQTAALYVALAAMTGVLTATVVPGVLTVDENSYLVSALTTRQGRLTLGNTEGLPPSGELLAFDPAPRARKVTRVPVASTAPPLYGAMALPFWALGWRGLVAINTLAFVVTTLLIFQYTARRAVGAATPWIAAGAFALGAFNLEYAQGLWPHMLSVALCTAGVLTASQALDDEYPSSLMVAGLCLGLATGVRYQNAVVLTLAAALVLVVSRRVAWAARLAIGASLPLFASSVINHFRQGSWNPISKGEGYLPMPLASNAETWGWDALTMFWARIVDFSARPPLPLPFMYQDADTGAHIVIGYVVKKALFQSAPWALLGLLMLLLCWLPSDRPRAQLRSLRFLFWPVVAILTLFAAAGVGRHDGLSFNERYLLEAIPFIAIAFAWSLDDLEFRPRQWKIGGAVGVALVVLCLASWFGLSTSWGWRLMLLGFLYVPLGLALTAVLVWAFAKRQALLGGLAAACIGWGFGAHVLGDLQGSRQTRAFHRSRTDAYASVLPDRSAVVAYYWHKEAALPLLFDRDVTVVNAWVDDGADAQKIIAALFAQGRRVFLLVSGFPPEVLARVVGETSYAPVSCCESQAMRFVELNPR